MPDHKPGSAANAGYLSNWKRLDLGWFSAAVFSWLVLLWILGLCEMAYQAMAAGTGMNLLSAVLLSWANLGLGWLLVCPWLLLIFVLAGIGSRGFARKLLYLLILMLVLIHLLLVNYFSVSLVPLGADLYGYSWKDIRQTVGSAGGIHWGLVVMLVTFLGMQWWLLHVFTKKLVLRPLTAAVIAGIGLILLCTGWTGVRGSGSEFSRNLVTDKTDYFFRQSFLHFFQHDEGIDIYGDDYLSAGNSAGEHSPRQYVLEGMYPFLYKDSAEDVLSPFFRKEERLPNIVIIIVEGLGRAFCNDGAYLGNFTPFLDSLSRKSLYWDNFLSEGGRTFAVLPSIMGSLPFARNGFLEMGAEMPSHFSFINLLKGRGYHTSFYYGGDAHFDNMDLYLRNNRIDELNDGGSFPAGYIKIPSNNGFSWGYNDAELFRRWGDTRTDEAASPQLSILLTVSMHSPFLLNDPKEYEGRFESRMTELGMDASVKEERRHYMGQYASILYTDEVLRNFFAGVRKRKDFDHTIFLITGDHRMPEIPMRDKIDRFHVPLIIYSPMLERTEQFSSVSTHYDIAPSLLAFLSHTHGWQMPGDVTWMGDGLDTARGFRNVHSYPLMQTKTDLVDYILGEDHLNGATLFRMKPDLNEEEISDNVMGQRVSSAMNAYRQRNERWLEQKALLPDSLYRQYVKP